MGVFAYNNVMALIQIKALPQKSNIRMHKVLKVLCEEVASRLGRLPVGFRATFSVFAAGDYVEGSSAVKVQPQSTHPPLVAFFAMEGMSDMEKENAMRTVSEVLEREFGLSAGNVHITFHETKAGHSFSNGRMNYHFSG